MMRKFVRCDSSAGLGSRITRSTVSASTFCAFSTPCRATRICEVGDSARSTEKTTSSAVSVAPSWNFTPSRNLKRQVRSLGCVHEVASQGMIFHALSRQTSGS